MKTKSGKKNKQSHTGVSDAKSNADDETKQVAKDDSPSSIPVSNVKPTHRTFQEPDESTMTPAELKRARKLARRAARREQALSEQTAQ